MKQYEKYEDFHTSLGEHLFDEGLICDGCPLAGTHCEGSNSGTQMDAFFEKKSHEQLMRIIYNNDDLKREYNNLSLSQKLKFKNPKTNNHEN